MNYSTRTKNEKMLEKPELEEDVSIHIFSVSAAMVGVCLTVIGIFQIGKLQEIGSISDNVLAVDAIAYLLSCILSYVALRTRTTKRRHIIEQIADAVFIAALSLMALVCVLVAYALI